MDTRQPDLTRQRILEAAFAEIHRHGFQAASLSKILGDTGLTKGALYHHFPDKKALGLAVVDEIIAGYLDDALFAPLRDAQRPGQALLDVIAGRQSTDEARIHLGCPLNNLMQEMSPIDEDFRAHLSVVLARWQTSIQSALTKAREAGDLRPGVDCRSAALFIVSAWEGCTGVAKNMQSPEAYRSCMGQLHAFVSGLMQAT